MEESRVDPIGESLPDRQSRPSGAGLIRLEGEPAARPAAAVPAASHAGPTANRPIPAYPVHLCPNCDYNLTGLTSRICPECGQPFNVRDARYHATRGVPEVRRYYRKVVVDRWMGRTAVVLLVWAIIMPNLKCSASGPWVKLGTTVGGWFILTLTTIMVLWAWLGQAVWDWSRPRVFLAAAVTVWALSMAVTLW